MAQAARWTGGDVMSALPTEDGFYWAQLTIEEGWEIIEIFDDMAFRTILDSPLLPEEFHAIHPTRITPPTDTTP